MSIQSDTGSFQLPRNNDELLVSLDFIIRSIIKGLKQQLDMGTKHYIWKINNYKKNKIA